MYDYKKSPFWAEYVLSLARPEDAGVIGFCEYLSDKIENNPRNIGDVAIAFMSRNGHKFIGYNEFGLLDEVFSIAQKHGIVSEVGSRGGKLNPHPLNRQLVVMNALDRDKRFRKFKIKCWDGRREALVREFAIKGRG